MDRIQRIAKILGIVFIGVIIIGVISHTVLNIYANTTYLSDKIESKS